MSSEKNQLAASRLVSAYFETLLSVQPAEAHRRDETQHLGEFVHSVLAHPQARDRMRAASKKVAFSAARQPGMPKHGW